MKLIRPSVLAAAALALLAARVGALEAAASQAAGDRAVVVPSVVARAPSGLPQAAASAVQTSLQAQRGVAVPAGAEASGAATVETVVEQPATGLSSAQLSVQRMETDRAVQAMVKPQSGPQESTVVFDGAAGKPDAVVAGRFGIAAQPLSLAKAAGSRLRRAGLVALALVAAPALAFGQSEAAVKHISDGQWAGMVIPAIVAVISSLVVLISALAPDGGGKVRIQQAAMLASITSAFTSVAVAMTMGASAALSGGIIAMAVLALIFSGVYLVGNDDKARNLAGMAHVIVALLASAFMFVGGPTLGIAIVTMIAAALTGLGLLADRNS